MEHFGVAPDLFLDELQRHLQVLADRRIAEGLGDLLPHLRLLFGEGLHRVLEIARYDHLHLVAIKGDQLAEKGNRQERVAGLRLLFEDDLRQHGMGYIFAGLGILNYEVLAPLHHDSQVVEGHVSARTGIVESPVRVFLDNDLAFVFPHQGLLLPMVPSLLYFSEYPQKSATDNLFVQCGDAGAKERRQATVKLLRQCN